MAELSAADFDRFFFELWQKRPFQWQRDLAHRVLTEEQTPWPEAIALPTASGKTACLDIAVFALAAQAERLCRGEVISAPRRIFFVVDRRVIVDEAFERARRLVKCLSRADGDVLKVVADNLRQVARGETEGYEQETPLSAHILRGGMYRSEGWARDPLQPIIVASTVDQVGSRLLFRAYGRGSGMWPVYAGLAANDSLILLDEAHCAQPFLQTLQGVRRYRTWAEEPLGRSFFPVVMSATPPPGLERFEDTSAERLDPEHPLGRRQMARKPAFLGEVRKAKGAKAITELARELAKVAEALVDEQRRAVVVFVNRVATARAVSDLLKKKYGEAVTLLTGRMRQVDKDDIVKDYLSAFSSAGSESRQFADSPRFVVATQTLEVGADLDFDGLVTECASLDALRQRFGRLNRMGRPIATRAAILVRVDQAGNSDDDPVYGPALSNTWKWLKSQENENGDVDFGIAELEKRLPKGEALAALNAPAVDAPVMLPAHVDCWVQTSPESSPSPDIGLFLHGPRHGGADVHVCWRADIDLKAGDRASDIYALESLSLCPPSSVESMPVPLHLFKRWLAGIDVEDDSSDVEGADDSGSKGEKQGATLEARRVIRWCGRETSRRYITDNANDIRPGDVIVIPAVSGGWNELGTLLRKLESPASIDVAERAFITSRAKPLLRLHQSLVDSWPDGAAKDLAMQLLVRLQEDKDGVLDERRSVRDILLAIDASRERFDGKGLAWLGKSVSALLVESESKTFHRAVRVLGRTAVFVIGQRRLAESEGDADVFSDEDDSVASGTSRPDGKPVALLSHLPGVAGFAGRFAKGCGLPDRLCEAVETAANLHDLGKADPRFQALLRAGNRWAIGELLAKSGDMPKSVRANEAARAVTGYPNKARHELLSVRLAESAPALLPSEPEWRDLVLHLIASHHGHCRPFAPVVVDEAPPNVELEFSGHRCHWSGPTQMERLDSGVPDRFWRLVRRYGWWGLAWLEALVRLSDHRRSEWEETHHEQE